MSEYYVVEIPATRSKEIAEQILDRVREDGWSANLRKVNPDAHPE